MKQATDTEEYRTQIFNFRSTLVVEAPAHEVRVIIARKERGQSHYCNESDAFPVTCGESYVNI
jgi:hypothetical protein